MMPLSSCKKKDPNLKLEHDNLIAGCYKALDYQYEALLTKADIMKQVDLDAASIETDISPIQGEYGSCTYRWSSDRPDIEMDMLGQMIGYPDDNRVTIKMMHFYTQNELEQYNQPSALALFNQSFKKLSQEDYDKLSVGLKKVYANDAVGYRNGVELLDQRMKFSYKIQESLGDEAYWKLTDELAIQVVVLKGSVHFTIEAKVHDEERISLNAAIGFAKEVLAKCN